MQNHFAMFRRGKVFYCEDRISGQQTSLRTRNEEEARKLIQARNEAGTTPQMNLALAKAYLAAIDPKLVLRTWADLFVRFCNRTNPVTRMRHERVVKTKAMLFLRDKKLIETTADHLLPAMSIGASSTIAFLQTLHNDALGMC